MAYCPNISNEQVVRDFNSIVEHFGGVALTQEEFRDPALRDSRTSVNKDAMQSAYYLWDKYAGDLNLVKLDTNYTKSDTGKFLEQRFSRYLIKEIGAVRQESVCNHIARTITKEIIANPDRNINEIRNEALARYKQEFIEDRDYFESSDEVDKDRFLEFYNPLISNFDTVARIVNTKVQKINNLIGEVNDDLEIDLVEVEDNEKINSDKSAYETKVTLSAEIKRLFADIDAPNRNILGEQDVMDYTLVDAVVKGLVSNLPQDYEIMKAKMLESKEAYPWITQLVNKLDNSGEKVQNMFVTEMNHHYVKHYMAMWQKVGNKFELSMVLANENAIEGQIISNWKSNLTSGNSVDVNGVLVKRDELLKRYTTFQENKNPEEVKAWLNDLGISLGDKSWNDIVNGNYVFKSKDGKVSFEKFISSDYSPIVHLAKKLKSIGDSSVEEFDIYADSSIGKFAKHEARFTTQVLSNSHRAGGKTVYSYGKNKYIVDFVRELKQSNLAKDILDKSGSFNSESIILKAFLDKDISFTENFEVSTVSLQALKKFGSKDKDGLELNNLGEDEYEIQELSGLYSPQQDVTSSNKRVGLLNFLTCSDKSTAMIVRTVLQNIGFNSNATLNNDSINKIYAQCVLPEIKRIKQWENMVKTNTKFTNSEFKNGGHMFHLIPSLNNLEGMWNSDGTININVESVEFRNSIENEIKRLVDKLVQDKLALWEKYGITKNGQAELLDFRTMQSFKLLEGLPKESYPKAIATDMVYQYMLGNANFFTGIVGDPAKFYKSKVYKKSVQELIKNDLITLKQSSDIALVWSKLTPEQRIKTIQEVYDNVGKRLAMYIAPGKSTADYEGEVNYIFVKDKMVDSLNLEQYKALLGEDKAKDYSKKGTLEEGTNAQEFTTFLEHLYVMDKSGLLPTGFYREIKDIVSNEISNGNFYYTQAIKDKLSEDSLKFFNDKLVCQVMKPVYSWFTVDETGVTPMYIKTSSYPLLPELTANKELDKVRIMMEKNGLQRLSFPSGTKLGMPTEPVTLWDENGNVREDIASEEILKGKKILPRMGFRLQQEVPYDALKDYINRVSQADKNLFINLLDIDGFEYEGQVYKGEELQKIYEKYYGELYKLGYDELVDELSIKFDDAGNVVEFDKKALKDILLEEAVKRDYTLNDIEALDLDEALDYIAFMPSANKYEALLNAIVKNRVLQMKFKGKSFVLSTEEGYQSITGDNALDGVIYTDKWQGTLDPGHFEDSEGNTLTGEELKKAWKDGTAIAKRPAQVLMPWKFKDDNGKLHIEDYINKETGRIDTTKLPEELMQLFGMRIPNQGPNSQSWIEVAGFLPKKSGDIIIATRDYLTQMGSDFDVDKFYTYMYNYSIKNGKLKKIDYTSKDVIRDEARRNELWRQSLQNKLLDIHLALHRNTDKTVQYQISEPLGFWEFKDIADEIAATQPYNPDFTALSDAYQRTKRLNASMGKTLVGDFSNLSMFNAAAQGKNLYLRKSNGEKVFIRFDETVSNGDLSNQYTIATQKLLEKNPDLDVVQKVFKSQVIAGLQSSAVDNEKEQILDKLNLNSQTARYAKLLAQLGFENEVAYFMRQPIIVDYFNELKRLRSSLGAYTPNAEELAENFVMKKYKTSSFNDKLYDENFAKGKGLNSANMKNSIINPDANFNYIQIAAFEQMQYLKKYADDLQAIQSAINTDSKGLDKSLFETLSKEDAVDNMNQKSIANTDALLDNTINGFATDNGLRLNNKLWSNLFPYRQHGIVALFETIEKTINKSDVGIGTRATLRSNIWKEFKSYMFSLRELGLYGDVDIKAERERLFIDSETNKSLASKVKEIQKLPAFVNHPFLSRLVPVTSKGVKPSVIKMNTGIDPSAELLIVQAATDLYVNDREIPGLNMTTKQLFEELVKASYLSGGIQEFVQYIKYMPVAYLFDKGFTENISNKVRTKFFEDLGKLDIPGQDAPYWALPTFVIQYLQHDQRGVQTLPKVGYEKDIKIMSSDKSHVTSVKVEKFSLVNSDYYVDTKNGQKPPVALVISSVGRVKGLDDNVLFIHTGEKDSQGYPIYTRLSNKGSFAFSEYNFGVKYDKSSIESYNSISELKELEARYPENKDVSDVFENPEHKEIQVRDILGIVDSGNIENVKTIINNIAAYSDDTFQQELAKEFNKHMNKLSVNFSTNLHKENTAGSFWNNTVYVNMDVDVNKSLSGISQTILHEVTHGFVNSVLEQYETNPSSLSGDTKKAVADLKRLQSIYISRTKEKFGDRFNELHELVKNKKYDLIKDRGELLEIYAADYTKLQEFTALAISNPEIQKVLNEINDPNAKERGLLDKFIDIVQNLLNSIGFNIKKGSLLGGAIQDTLVIIKGDNNVEVVDNVEEDFLPIISSKEQILKDTNELNADGTSKKYIVNDANYKRVFKKAQDINKSQAFYKATVGTTYGEDVIRSGRQYYYIRLEQREVSIKEKMNTISDAQIFERLRNCR